MKLFDKVEKKHSITIELVVGLLAVSFLIYALRSMLIFGETTLLHDNVLWRFPTFHFFTENIMNGRYPLWNPFSHGGEPFYPLLMFSGKLFDPLTLVVIYLIQFFSDDIFLLFNWNHFILSLVMLFGVYILLRPVAKHLFIRLTLIIILPYSSFMLCSFRQPGFIFMFVWATYTLYFLLRIIYYKDYRWHNWLFFSAFFGLNCQAYLFVGIGMFLLFFAVGILFFRRDLLKELFKEKKIVIKFAAACTITLTMMMPNIVLMSEKGNYVYPARMVDKTLFDGTPKYGPMQIEGTQNNIVKGINMSYGLISYTGTFSTIWDFIQTISPEGNYFISNKPGIKGNPSEAYMYLGLLPWAIALFGIVMGRHGLKKVFLFILLAFGLLMLGPAGGLHRFLYYLYPPLWFIRHTHSLVLFFLLAFLYFYVLGMNSILSKLEHSPFSININFHGIIAAVLFSTFFVCLVFWMTQLKFPSSNYLFVFVLLIIAVGWRLRHELGKTGLYISLIASHIILVLIIHFEPMLFIKKIVLFLGLPIALLWLIKRNKKFSKISYTAFLLFIIFAIGLIWDLTDHLKLTTFLYQGQQYPKKGFNPAMAIRKPALPQNRKIVLGSRYSTSGQSMRYLSLVYRQAYVFSPVIGFSKPNDTFETVLARKRWNSFFLPKKYFELIHSGIHPEALEEMFAVGKPLFQFKQGVVSLEDDKQVRFLRKLGTDKAVQFLTNYILVDKEVDSSLNRFKISTSDYNKMIAESSPHHRNKNFSYSIINYEYNSFDIKTSTDKQGILYWSEGYDKNWHAYVNGKEVPISRANINFKAIVLPKGTNSLTFTYNPVLFKTSLITFYVTLIISIMGGFIVRFFQQKNN